MPSVSWDRDKRLGAPLVRDEGAVSTARHLSLAIYRYRRQPYRWTSYGRVICGNAEDECLRRLGEITDYLSQYLQLSDRHRRDMH